jgi:Zn-dependent M28 family amino/carboxypeptidase
MIAAALAATALLAASGAPANPDAVAMTLIRPEAIRAHIRFLSDGLLEGRAPDGRGYQVAAAYVATQMEGLGLEPAGEKGSWQQAVPMRKATLDEEKSRLTLVRDGQEEPLAVGTDWIMPGDVARTASDVEAPVVFAGYGVTAPGRNYDDYKGVDARGKIVAFLRGAPASFPDTERAHFSNRVTKLSNAVAHGAVGILTLDTPEFQKRYSWSWFLPQFRAGAIAWLQEGDVPRDTFPELRGGAILNLSASERLFQGAKRSAREVFDAAQKGAVSAFDLKVAARLHLESRHTEFTSANVLGLLRGSDPVLASQVIVYTAHLDHLGLCPPVDGDNVCHGAFDNASGVAAMLEVARAFKALDPAPRRSILFAAVTGEEKGLLGSDYLALHPAVPGARVVADVNIDSAPGLLLATRDLVPLGAEHSTLRAPVEEAMRETGYEIGVDAHPEETDFIRSDQYSFVRAGVPAVDVEEGSKSAVHGVDADATMMAWIRTRYHTPADRFDQPFDFESAAKAARLNFLIGSKVARAAAPPAWNAGDFFGSLYGKGAATGPATSASGR